MTWDNHKQVNDFRFYNLDDFSGQYILYVGPNDIEAWHLKEIQNSSNSSLHIHSR